MKPKRLTNAELLKRVEALEAELAALKVAPREVHHHHYPWPTIQPQQPQPYVAPQWQPMQPASPYPLPQLWCHHVGPTAGDVRSGVIHMTVTSNPPEDNAGGVLARTAP